MLFFAYCANQMSFSDLYEEPGTRTWFQNSLFSSKSG